MLLFANNATTECAGSITAAATQINVNAGEGVLFPNPGPGDYFVLTLYKNDASELHEIVHCTARNGDTFTIVRAQEATQAQPWNPGDTVSALITAGMLGLFDQGGIEVTPASLVYTGVDTGGPNVIVVPIISPAITGGLVAGMTFDIAIAATCTGPTTCTINGFATYPVVRLDGSNLVDGNLIGGMMMKMWFDGAQFICPLQPVAVHPISNRFYLDPAGNDANDGLSPTTAFKSPGGAVNAIESRYASHGGIEIMVADGTYQGGCDVSGSYIAFWHFIGNIANPDAVVFDCRDPAIQGGICFVTSNGSNVLVDGVKFLSYQFNLQCGSGGNIEARYCVFTPPTAWAAIGYECPAIYSSSGTIWLIAEATYEGDANQATAFWEAGAAGTVILSEGDAVNFQPLRVTFRGTPNFGVGTAVVRGGGMFIASISRVTFVNAASVVGRKHFADTGGGISTDGAPIDWLPGNQPGIVDATTFGWFR